MDKLGPYELNKIYTGDAKILAEEIPDESVDLIFTDPVYDRIEDYEWLAKTAARILKNGGVSLISFGIGYLDDASAAMRGHGLDYRWEFVWYQSNNMQRADPGYCKWSPIRWYEKGRSKPRYPIQDLRNVPVRVGRERDDKYHSWAKNYRLVLYYLDAFCDPNSIVFDPFVGGGTVCVVCKMLNQNYLAFEINPETAELARQRVAQTQPPLPMEIPEQIALL